MRSIVWAAAILLACGLAAPAAGQGLGWGGHMGCGGYAACGLYAPACGFSISGGPSCCEAVPCCAMHAWDGYCGGGACDGCAQAVGQPEMAHEPAVSGTSSRLFELFQWAQTKEESVGPASLKSVAHGGREPGATPTTLHVTY